MTNSRKNNPVSAGPQAIRGLSLVELMISLVLGLLVVGAAISVFLSNQQTYRATESLGRVQENARVAFELMARDIREAAGNPCGNNLPVVNVLEDSADRWFTNFSDGIRGVDGAFTADEPVNRVADTDAVELLSGEGGASAVSEHTGTSIRLSSPDHKFEADDVLMACDNHQAAIFQMTGNGGSSETVVSNTGTGNIGNCTADFAVPLNCASPPGNPLAKKFKPPSVLVKLRAVRWYVGTNDRGGRSLYRLVLRGGEVDDEGEEVTDGVENLQITYLLPAADSYVPAEGAGGVGTRWNEVLAARVEIWLEGDDRVGPGGEFVERRLVHTATLRNRNP